VHHDSDRHFRMLPVWGTSQWAHQIRTSCTSGRHWKSLLLLSHWLDEWRLSPRSPRGPCERRPKLTRELVAPAQIPLIDDHYDAKSVSRRGVTKSTLPRMPFKLTAELPAGWWAPSAYMTPSMHQLAYVCYVLWFVVALPTIVYHMLVVPGRLTEEVYEWIWTWCVLAITSSINCVLPFPLSERTPSSYPRAHGRHVSRRRVPWMRRASTPSGGGRAEALVWVMTRRSVPGRAGYRPRKRPAGSSQCRPGRTQLWRDVFLETKHQEHLSAKSRLRLLNGVGLGTMRSRTHAGWPLATAGSLWRASSRCTTTCRASASPTPVVAI
jgi:hypothetical protein